jgi:deoxyribose-phosphate aldolase
MLPQQIAIARLIDHSCLAPTARVEEFRKAVAIAAEWQVATVCVPSFFVDEAVAELGPSAVVGVCTTIGFPHGNSSTGAKLREAELALERGAREVDVVVNLTWVKSGEWQRVKRELDLFCELVKSRQGVSKLIFEMAYLELGEKEALADLASEAGFDFVKTSTGFAASGATLEDVELLRKRCPPEVSVKASGGIRTLEAVLQFRQRGASRIGTSATVAILSGLLGSVERTAAPGSGGAPPPHGY